MKECFAMARTGSTGARVGKRELANEARDDGRSHRPVPIGACTAADYWGRPTWTGLLVPVLVGSSTLVAVIVKVPSLPK